MGPGRKLRKVYRSEKPDQVSLQQPKKSFLFYPQEGKLNFQCIQASFLLIFFFNCGIVTLQGCISFCCTTK